jgi:hypothetical protein
MKNNPYVLSVSSGLVIYIIQVLLKQNKGEKVDKMESLKMSLFVTIGTFLLLNVYEKEKYPVLSEPFISSCEV